MAKLLGAVGEALGDTLGASWLGPVVLGGVIVAVVSPEVRNRLRTWGVQGIAAAMAAGDVAAKRMRNTDNGTGGMVNQLGQRIIQAASELREEWEDFLAEAQAVKNRSARSSDGKEHATPDRPRRRVSKPRARRPAG
ncbi:MAG TPA: hypothetical protein VKV57_13155 [bacterium]|nr:hypothetical protein [bacterium]